MAHIHRIVVLGSEGVGKTSLITRFIRGGYSIRNKPTVEDCYWHVVRLSNGTYRHIEVLDTGGDYQFPVMRELNIRLGHAFVVVYSVDDPKSYLEAKRLCRQIIDIKGTLRIPIVLVGNKLDAGNKRVISTEKALTFASKINCSFVETSAELNLNISCTFQIVLPSQDPRAQKPPNIKSLGCFAPLPLKRIKTKILAALFSHVNKWLLTDVNIGCELRGDFL